VTTAAAFLAFSRTPADACIIEVGLGGRLDATNVIERPVATGIAQLGIDHQAFLGETIEQIAGEKAGIAKPGVPLVTMTACGTAPANASTVPEFDLLCLRWLQLSAFMPAMASFHGPEDQPRLPYSMPGSYRDWSANAIRRRYQIMPYLYTVMRDASVHGWPVVRPLFFEFPRDDTTYTIADQFMLGDSILVSPVLDVGVIQLAAYFPYGSWYEMWSGLRLSSGSDSGTGSFKLLEDIPYQIAAYVRAGKIIPTLVSKSIN